MKCSDIPSGPILELLARNSPEWSFLYSLGREDGSHDQLDGRCVASAMPDGVPYKLRLAKMRQLMHRGVVDGCDCGCRGDFVITEKGLQELGG